LLLLYKLTPSATTASNSPSETVLDDTNVTKFDVHDIKDWYDYNIGVLTHITNIIIGIAGIGDDDGDERSLVLGSIEGTLDTSDGRPYDQDEDDAYEHHSQESADVPYEQEHNAANIIGEDLEEKEEEEGEEEGMPPLLRQYTESGCCICRNAMTVEGDLGSDEQLDQMDHIITLPCCHKMMHDSCFEELVCHTAEGSRSRSRILCPLCRQWFSTGCAATLSDINCGYSGC
jgi:hypothetical protein